MKRITLLTIVLCAIVQISNAQLQDKNKQATKANDVYNQVNSCSPYTALLLSNLKQMKSAEYLSERFSLIKIGNELFVSAFIKTNGQVDKSKLHSIGVRINSRTDNIFTAIIPINNLEYILSIKGIEYLEIGSSVEPKLDEARAKTWVDWVHEGMDLTQAYTGDGIVVGVIDGGFDYTHPTFYSSDNSQYRISRVWSQNETGTPPTGYSYGNELIGETNILNDGYDNGDGSHGTHVAGIAAGSGSSLPVYKGVAFNSEIVLVSMGQENASILDGISYIFNYANSVGKPAVVNMSLGTHIGPHDGTSLFDQSCDGIVGEGKILVGAAGNEGGDKLHLDYNFSSEETIYSFIEFPHNTDNPNGGTTFIDIWGEVDKDFVMAINIFNTQDEEFVDYTEYISTSTNGTYSFTLNDTDPDNSDQCTVEISVEHSNPNNEKPHVFVVFDNTDQNEPGDIYDYVMLEVVGTSTSFDAWCSGAGEALFANLGNPSPIIDGNTNITVGEIGGTASSIITVGAYTSKNTYTDFQGNNHNIPAFADVGKIAPFSSLGPTVDGRTKPDISAPGNVIVSSVNSFDENYTSTTPTVVTNINNGTDYWWFATMEGTSMASPMVTGIVALWLEADPTLTPTEIKQFMNDNVFIDEFTGSVPNNTWGNGKIDAHEAIKAIENAAGIEIFTNNIVSFFPNPSNGKFTIQIDDRTINRMQIFDTSGKIVFSDKISSNESNLNIDLSYLTTGFYIIEMTSEEQSLHYKILIDK